MSTPTPRTDEAAYRVWGIENVNASLSRTLETELTAANARITELENERNPNCDGSLASHLAESNQRENEGREHLRKATEWNKLTELELTNLRSLNEGLEKDIEELKINITSLTLQLSEFQAQLANARDSYKTEAKQRHECIRLLNKSEADLQDLRLQLEVERDEKRERHSRIVKLEAQLASAREDGERLGKLMHQLAEALEPWRDCPAAEHLPAIKNAKAALISYDCHLAGRTSPPASAEPGPASTWQPIETAPRDGRRVLLWGVNLPGEAYHCIEAWFDEEWWGTYGNSDIHNATFWQPLPPPPTQDGKE